jgi:hypothetical protein
MRAQCEQLVGDFEVECLRGLEIDQCWTPKAYSSEDLWTSEKIFNFGLGDWAWCSERRASTDASQRALHGGHLEGVAGYLLQLGVLDANSSSRPR